MLLLPLVPPSTLRRFVPSARSPCPLPCMVSSCPYGFMSDLWVLFWFSSCPSRAQSLGAVRDPSGLASSYCLLFALHMMIVSPSRMPRPGHRRPVLAFRSFRLGLLTSVALLLTLYRRSSRALSPLAVRAWLVYIQASRTSSAFLFTAKGSARSPPPVAPPCVLRPHAAGLAVPVPTDHVRTVEVNSD